MLQVWDGFKVFLWFSYLLNMSWIFLICTCLGFAWNVTFFKLLFFALAIPVDTISSWFCGNSKSEIQSRDNSKSEISEIQSQVQILTRL